MSKKFLSMFLALSMMFTMLPVWAMAEEAPASIGTRGEIIAFTPLAETEKSVTVGTSTRDLDLPEYLTATVLMVSTRDSIAWEEKVVEIPVTWTSVPEYEMDTEGLYLFTPVIEGYTVSAVLPDVSVTVAATVLKRGLFSPMSATEYELWVNGVRVTSDNTNDVLENGKVSYDDATKTLTLNNAQLTNAYTDNKDKICICGNEVILELIGENSIVGVDATASSYGIACNKLTIQGEGSLTVTSGKGSGSYNESSAIRTIKDLTISGGTLNVSGEQDGLYGYTSNITINGGTVTAQGGNCAIRIVGLGLLSIDGSKNAVMVGDDAPGEPWDGTTVLNNNYKYIKIEPVPIAAPSIATQPSNQTVYEGQTATFTVSATGTEPYTYQWQVSDNDGSSWENVTVGTGGRRESYTTAVTTSAMNGYKYRCQVTNAGGTATSNEVLLTVTEDVAETTGIFIGRYSFKQVFDCQRDPVTPVAGQSFRVFGFALPYNSISSLRFTQEEIKDKIFYIKTSSTEGAPFALYMADDVDGTNERSVSDCGNIYGLGKEGFLYVDKIGDYGYLISNTEAHNYGGSFTYDPDIAGPITLEEARAYLYGNEKPQEKVMASITVKTAPTNLTYFEGDMFDPAGLVITLNYDDSTSQDVAYAENESLFTFTPSLTTALSALDNQIDIKYGSKTVTQAITVSTLSIEDIAAVTYNGAAQTPTVVVKDGEKKLTEDVHYTLSYSNNINAGTAEVTVIGIGDYEGRSESKTFTINRADVTNNKNDQTVTYTGQPYDISQLFSPDSNAGTPSYTIETGGTGEGTLSGNLLTITKAGTIIIGMVTAQTENYNAGSKITLSLTVNKGAQDAPTGIAKQNTSMKDSNNGKILNVSTAMEYKGESGEYTDVTGSEISGLSKGVYTIRYKETDVYSAGLKTQITIDEPSVIKTDETVPDDIMLETPTQSGDTLEIKVAKTNVTAPEIAALSGRKLMAVVLDITAEVNSLPTNTLSHIIKLTLPIPDVAKGRSITVYRLHEGLAEAMPAGEANKNVDGEYVVIGMDTILIYAKNFSQYAIAYTRPSRGGSGSVTQSYKITVTQSDGGKISPDTVNVTKNSSKTFTITPDDGYEIQDVLINGKSVGKVTEYKFEKVMSAASITAIFKKSEENPAEPTIPAKWENPFTDINEKDWFYEAVKYVYENELMNGTDKTHFVPDIEVTRAMFVTVLYRAEKQPNAGVSSFTDIESGSYYEKAVAWVAANGIVKGVTKTEFAPNDPITREQMATIIQRYAIFKGLDVAVSKITSYADSANISYYAKEAVAFCTEHDIMSGKDSNIFAPWQYATRAEVAAVFQRVLKSLIMIPTNVSI